VLDDNCTLCLPNGERIKLKPDGMRLLFEVPDVKMASPATVSRCGMVYVPANQLGWRPLIQTWLSQSLRDTGSDAVKDFLLDLFEKTVDKGLEFIEQQGPQPIQCVDNQIVTTLAKFVQVRHPLKLLQCVFCR
jgi:dynein heavy chain, axonemal